MRVVSAEFLAAVKTSHRVAISATLSTGGVAAVASGLTLMVTGGQVQVDRSAAIRRSCSLTLVDPTGTLIPASAASVTAPYGTELTLSRGIVLASGLSELVPLGVFRLSSVVVVDNGAQEVRITGYDRSRTIARNKFTDVYIIAAGTNYSTAITTLLQNRLPGVTVVASSTTQTTPALFFDPATDPWDAATRMAEVIGMELFFDVTGVAILQPTTISNVTVASSFDESANCVVLDLSRQFTDEPGTNGVIITSETTSGTPARGEAWDTDASSPTYYLGNYGKVPAFETSQYAVTASQCSAAAAASLQRQMGGTEQVLMDVIPNPALAEGDTVSVTRAASKVSTTSTIETMTIPLSISEGMAIGLKQRRSAS